MDLSEKIKVCSTCQNRKMDMKRGIVCNITDEKPNFETTCESYLADEAAIARKKRIMKNASSAERAEIEEKLAGAHWFRTIAVLSVLNIIVSFFGIVFIFGLGTTLLLQLAIEEELINPVLGVACVILLPTFFFWTWWFSGKKGYKLAYNIGWVMYLLDTILLICIYTQTEASSLIVDIVIHIAVLFVCLKIFKVNSREAKSRQFHMNLYGIGYLLYSVVVTIAWVYSVYGITNNVNKVIADENKNNIAAEIKDENKFLPMEIEDGLILKQIVEGKDSSIEIVYQLTNTERSEYTTEELEEMGKIGRLYFFEEVELEEWADLFRAGYSIYVRYIDAQSEPLYDYIITPEDYERYR